MKKITSLLISCSLAVAGALLAQQPEAEQSPKKTEKAHAAETKPKANAPNVGRTTPETGTKQRGATNKERTNLNAQKTEAPERGRRAAPTETKAAQSAPPQAEQGRKGQKVRGENAASARPLNSPMTAPEERATPVTATKQTTTTAPAINQANAGANRNARKPDAHQVQAIKEQHTNFQAQPRPDRVPAVTFSANHRIEGAEHWQGSQYEVFRAYHPEWHDQAWYRGHYNRVVLIGGGYYYWRDGCWYPAWGYDPSAAYYVYDGPIYVGHRAEPPDQVIADVQAELQQMGYYQGEVDGLLGPLTRQALSAYQADHGLVQTAAIDEPTLDSLELG